jgi:CO/xanthine dehydrogenase Mo-binding subunit/aerobic-type carbon monoxide dehydrogenase small subunit (CoxS/CutS family)
LLSVLREELGMLGTRAGCGIGECGACTVLSDGKAVRSCITPLGSVAGTQITTPEGLGTADSPGAVQRAFLQEQAAQCGYCINGIIMRTQSLRNEPAGDEAAFLTALDEHICRCGTHLRILRAARRVLGLSSQAETTAADRSGDGDVVRREPQDTATQPAAPLPVGSNVSDRLRLLDDGRVEVLVGKVELGQGIRAAFAQVVAAGLGVPVHRVVVRHASTADAPDDGYTSGSGSLEDAGVPLAAATVAFRRLLLARAARDLGAATAGMRIDVDRVLAQDGQALTLADLAARGGVAGRVEANDVPDWGLPPLGVDVPRADLPVKLTGEPAYVHDMVLPGMLHARVLLPPSYEAVLADCDLRAVTALPGVVEVHRDGNFVLVLAERSYQAVQAVSRLARTCRWDDPGLRSDGTAWLQGPPTDTHAPREDPVPELDDPTATIVTATFSKPYEAHAPVAPSSAVAIDEDGHLSVWTHSQGIFALRAELSTMLGIDESSVTVHHRDGPGCYGHNAADDAAAFAALAARRVSGRAVRFHFSVQDEFLWEPFGSAMEARLVAALDASGTVTAWRHVARTDLHHARPDGSGDRLVPAWLQQRPVPRPRPRMGDPGTRNAVPPYDIPAQDVRGYFVQGPLRTSSLRSLGAYLNTFAAESFMDELAETAGQDPLAFRLRHLRDPRARTVLELAAERAGWEPHVGPSGRGQGLALCRYKNVRAYVALVVDAAVDTDTAEVTVTRVVVACDAGGVVSPGGLRNQLEGGVLQGLSRALYEHVSFDRGGIRSRDWTSYPVLRFSGVPAIDVTLVDRRRHAPLGAGEASTPPLPAALANAVDDAVGVRMRDLPITPARLQQRLASMTDAETARVRL